MKRSHAHLCDGPPFHSLQAQIFPHFVWTEIVLRITTQKITYETSFHPSSVQTVEASTTMQVKERGYLQVCL